MDDVAALCPRVIVIDKGKLSYDGALDELVKRVRPEKRVTLRFSKPVGARATSSARHGGDARPGAGGAAGRAGLR